MNREAKMTDVFVSYASNDCPKVTRLVKELQDKGFKIWFDEDQILPGDDLVEKMAGGIAQCKAFVICLSPSFEKRPPLSWVKKEFKMAILKEHSEQKGSMIPVRIKKGGAIPAEIGEKAYADLTTGNRWGKNFPRLCKALKNRIDG